MKQANSPQEALQILKEGNELFVKSEQTHHASRLDNSHFSVVSQSPMAIIVACADSRVSPEIVFDAGLGELFTIRVAGNVAGSLVLESITYGVEALHAPLIVVLGHQNCGAVDAVITDQAAAIPEIANLIEAGLNEYHYDHAHKNLKEAIIDNVKYNRAIVEKHVSSEKIESGQLAVVGAYFDFETKKVMFLDS